MKFPKKTIFTSRHVWHMFTLTLLVAIMAVSATAQRSVSGSKMEDTSKELLAEAATLEQCRNGADGLAGCIQPGGNVGWVTGNAGSANSSWFEDDFLPYRMLFSGLTVGVQSTVTIGYDRIHSDVNAIDYLGTYNYTETNNNPCVGVAGCTLTDPDPNDPAYNVDTIAVPLDIVYNTTINTIPGDFTIFGGTFVSAEYVDCPTNNLERRCIQITFIPDVTNPVMAWGGHVAWRGDWGDGNSAGGITGSPYHMRLIELNGSGGNQDRSLSANAVSAPGKLTIVKKTFFGLQEVFVDVPFTFESLFTFTVNNGPANQGFFVLNTNSPATTETDEMTVRPSQLGTPIVVTEAGGGTGNWSLTGIECVETGDPQFPGNDPNNSTVNVLTFTATARVERGESVVCTFTNALLGTTSAPASISGRVSAADGTGIYGARMVLTNASTGETHYAITNPFGYYTFEGMPVSDFYIIGVSRKGYTFAENQRTFTLEEDLTGVDFIAN